MSLSARIAHERLAPACFIDCLREMALVAEQRDVDGRAAILGVGRLAKIQGTTEEKSRWPVRRDQADESVLSFS